MRPEGKQNRHTPRVAKKTQFIKSVITNCEPNQVENIPGLATENILELNPLTLHRPSTSLLSPMRETLERSQVLYCTEEGDPPERQLDREKTAKVWVIGSDTYWSIC